MTISKPKTIVGLIPARSGSVRVPDKNIRVLGRHPLISYSISAAINSGIFNDIIICTDSEKYASIGKHYGAAAPFLRPKNISEATSPDIEWVRQALQNLEETDQKYDFFCILRPTSPFRKAETIQRAWQQLTSTPQADTLRAVEKCTQHPGKMWTIEGDQIKPIMPFEIDGQPWHSNQYAKLPEIWVQNASLEIAKTDVISRYGKITGNHIIPFFTQDFEGHDINHEDDFELAEKIIAKNNDVLPPVNVAPFYEAYKN